MDYDRAPRELSLQPAHEHAQQLANALWELDRAVEAALTSEVAGGLDGLYELDEVRGRIWSRYEAASDSEGSRAL